MQSPPEAFAYAYCCYGNNYITAIVQRRLYTFSKVSGRETFPNKCSDWLLQTIWLNNSAMAQFLAICLERHFLETFVRGRNPFTATYCNHFPPPSFHLWFRLPAAAGGNLVGCTASSQSPSAGVLWEQRAQRGENENLHPQILKSHLQGQREAFASA